MLDSKIMTTGKREQAHTFNLPQVEGECGRTRVVPGEPGEVMVTLGRLSLILPVCCWSYPGKMSISHNLLPQFSSIFQRQTVFT